MPMPLGDVLDRITILRVKTLKVSDAQKLANVRAELQALQALWAGLQVGELPEEAALEQVNESLWDVEDQLRRHEAARDFGAQFVQRARSVYQLNDRRAALKRAVSLRLGSRYVEEKQYVEY